MIAALIIAAAVTWLVVEFATSPMGYQDAAGFHLGQPTHDAGRDGSEGLGGAFHASEVFDA